MSPDFVPGLRIPGQDVAHHAVIHLRAGDPDVSDSQAKPINAQPLLQSGQVADRESQHHETPFRISSCHLPNQPIIVIHRSDGSGTTYIWTDYLSKISSDWKDKVGKGTSVSWPVGLGGKGNEGVSGLLKQTPNSIGYVELIYAAQNKITYGAVKNAAGNFVKADLASVSEAAAAAAKTMPDDFRVSITNAPGKNAYPVSSFTWLLLPEKFKDGTKRDAMKNFVKWAITDGQNDVEALSYAKLPKEVVDKELKALGKVM